uniref:Uncharacterized protein n=1 Tax=Molossus molossus TaxID=27622 RepID=A0A7J8GKZ3_MOLMO|nr:hypothetical protein HJG59_011515 [Molossus molossus]
MGDICNSVKKKKGSSTQIATCPDPWYCGESQITAPSWPRPCQSYRPFTQWFQVLVPLHFHSGPEQSRKTYFSSFPSFKIFVSCGSCSWDEEGFTVSALGTRPGSVPKGLGQGTRISGFQG